MTREVKTLATLARRGKLAKVHVLGLAAVRKETPLEEPPRVPIAISVGSKRQEGTLFARFTAEGETALADYRYDIVGEFIFGDEIRFSDDLGNQFITTYAFATLHGVLREGLFWLSQRLGVETVALDYLKPGPIELSMERPT